MHPEIIIEIVVRSGGDSCRGYKKSGLTEGFCILLFLTYNYFTSDFPLDLDCVISDKTDFISSNSFPKPSQLFCFR